VLNFKIKKSISFYKGSVPVFFVILLMCAGISSCKTGLFQKTDTERAFVNNVQNKVWPHQNSDLKPDSSVVYGVLPNGFRYILMKNAKPENRVSMHLDVQAGSANEIDEERGIAHYLEHILFCGSTHFKPGELIKYFQSIGMQFGSDANAHTGFSETVYDIELPEGDMASLEKGLLVARDYADGALILQSEIDRERKVILSEKRTRDSASYRTSVAEMKFQFPDLIYSNRLPIGLESVIKGADSRLLRSFYKKWYRPKNMVLVITGDFDVKTAESLIEKRFYDMKAKNYPVPKPDTGSITNKGIRVFYHYEKEEGDGAVSLGRAVLAEQLSDTISTRKEKLIEQICNQMVRERLRSLAGKPHIPFISASIGSGIFQNRVHHAEINAVPSPGKWEEALSFLEKTLREVRTYGFNKTELDLVKKSFCTGLETSVKKASTRNSRHLAAMIIRSINNGKVFLSPKQNLDLYKPVIQSVSIEDVNRKFRKIWKQDHLLVSVTGNIRIDSADQNPEKYIGSVINKSMIAEVKKHAKEKISVFPYLPEPVKKSEIVKRNVISDSGIVQIDFKNGVRVNLKKTDFKKNEVIFSLNFGRGRFSEPADKPGLSFLASAAVNLSALKGLDRNDLRRAFADKNTSAGFSCGADSFSYDGETVSNEVRIMFQRLYAHMTDQAYRKDAFDLAQKRIKSYYLRSSSTVEGAMASTGSSFLGGGDSRFGLPEYSKIKDYTLDDVKSWVENAKKNGDLELSIVGDFDVEKTILLASKYLGSLYSDKPQFEKKDTRKPVFPAGKDLKLNVKSKIPKGVVVIVFPTADHSDIKRTRRLSILSRVYSERLRKRIRVKLGAAYSPYAYNRSSRVYRDYGEFRVVVNISPADADTVVKEVQLITEKIVKEGVSEDELQKALKPTLNQIKVSAKNNSYWLDVVLSGSKDHPEYIDWSSDIYKDYASIKADELSVLAGKYLINKKAAKIIIRPVSQKKR